MLLDDKNEKYKILVEKLYNRCQEIQVENERCVLRINTIKKLSRRRERDVEILKRRLDKHNDNWRSLPMVAPHPKRKIEQKRGPKPKAKNPNEEPTEKKVRKQRVKKNAPIQDVIKTSKVMHVTQNMNRIVPQEMLTEQQTQQLLLLRQTQHQQQQQQ